MGRLDVDSLFINILLEETINICANTLFENTEKINLSKIEFKELLSPFTKESHFIFNWKLYKQVDGVAMGLSLGPTLASVLLERNWLQNCPSDSNKPCY